MRKALRILTTLVAILLTGILPTRGDACELATVPCNRAALHLTNCCRGALCHCDMSAPCRSASNRIPARTAPAPGHRVAKVTVVSAGASQLVSEVDRHPALSASANASTPVPSSYLWTHAFLI